MVVEPIFWSWRTFREKTETKISKVANANCPSPMSIFQLMRGKFNCVFYTLWARFTKLSSFVWLPETSLAGLTDRFGSSVITAVLQQPHQLPLCDDRWRHTQPPLQMWFSGQGEWGCHGNIYLPTLFYMNLSFWRINISPSLSAFVFWIWRDFFFSCNIWQFSISYIW